MKILGIGKIFFHFEADEKIFSADASEARLEQALVEIDQVLSKFGLSYCPGYTSFWGVNKYSISRCQRCQHLMTNNDRNPLGLGVDEITRDIEWVVRRGGELAGELLCDECLPATHRWASS